VIERTVRLRVSPGFLSFALLLVALVPTPSLADVAAAINKARAQDCGVRTALRENPRLGEVARLLSRGTALSGAERLAGYHASSTVSVQLSGVTDDRSIEEMAGRLCAQLGAARLRELGAYQRGQDLWVALAEPFTPPDPRAAAAIGRRVLELTNLARSQARTCGATWFPAAPALTFDPLLEHAAIQHSQDMAKHGYLDHSGSDGSTPADRVTQVGYAWRQVGENVASGDTTADEVVASWLMSPHHCENMMRAGYRQMGVAFSVNLDTEGGVYWTQVFASPTSQTRSER